MKDRILWTILAGVFAIGGLFEIPIAADEFRWFSLSLLAALIMEVTKLREKGE